MQFGSLLVYRAGNGGCGEIVGEGKGKLVKNLKYQKGRQLKKHIWLNASKYHLVFASVFSILKYLLICA